MSKKPVHLVCVEEKTKGDGVDHNKFYDMFERNGECYCLYGRQQDGYEFGKTGTKKTYPLSKWDSIYNQKVAKGYEDKSHIVADLITMQDTASKKSEYAPISNSVIAEIVERLQRYAKETIEANYSVKPGKVTQAMIDDVQMFLNKMTYTSDTEKFNDLLKEIFKTISRSMSRVDLYLLQDSNNTEDARNKIISREQDLLDVLRGQIIVPSQNVDTTSDSKNNKKTILEVNGITMDVATPEDIELVKKKLGSNASRLKNVWKVSNAKQSKAYETYCKDENIRKRDAKLLWHGTRSENVWNILKTGLVLRPTNAVITGKMFGYGLYFAPSAQKSLGYTSLSGSYWARGNAKSGFMILHAVAYGNPYDVYNFDSKYYNFNYENLRRVCPGANCLHAHKDKGMLKNDEIVVYKEEQVMPLYLVELE